MSALVALVRPLLAPLAAELAPLLARQLGGRSAPQAADPGPGLLTYQAAAERYGVTSSRLRRAVASHELPAVVLGRSSVLLEPAAVEAWLHRHRVGTADEVPRLRRVNGGRR